MKSYKVSGEKDGVHSCTVYKSKAAALRFADTLTNSEVYSVHENKYIAGSSKFVQRLLKMSDESLK